MDQNTFVAVFGGGGGAHPSPEINVDANAIGDPNGSEVDAVTGWNSDNLAGQGANVFESQGSVKSAGSYAFHGECNDTPTAAAGFYQTFTVESGASYLVKFDWRHVGIGQFWRFITNEGAGQTGRLVMANTTTVFESVEHTAVMTSTSLQLVFRTGANPFSGGVYVDNLSIKKIT